MNLYQLGELKTNLPEIQVGDTVKVSEKIPEEKKKKSQVFKGVLIARKHGKGINATFTLRAVMGGVGVEKTYPLHSPLIEKIEVLKKGKTRRAKLYYLRNQTEKESRKRLRAEKVINRNKIETGGSKIEPKKSRKEEKKSKPKTGT